MTDYVPAPPPSAGGDFKKTAFYKLEPGKHRFRVVSHAVQKLVHFLNNVSFECPGEEDCPVCLRNAEILAKAGGDKQKAKEQGWKPYNTNYYINIVSRNPVKIHPESEGYENPPFAYGENGEVFWPPVCKKTAKPLTEVPVTVSNKVYVLRGSPALFWKNYQNPQAVTFNDLYKKFGGAIPCDVQITSIQKENSTIKTFILEALENETEPVDVNEEDLFDLENITIKLTSEEIVSILAGVSLRDIFAARKAEGNFVADVTPEEKAELVTTAQSLASSLFGGGE